MNQQIFSLAILVFTLNIFPGEASSQKVMKLNDSLKASSDPLPVKIRGGSILKFDFGLYKTLSAKGGLIKTTSKSKLFSAVENSESKQKASIVILGNESDTATINISVNEKSEAVREHYISFSKDRVAWEQEEDPSQLKLTTNLVGIITVSRDSTTWNFLYIAMGSTENWKGSKYPGILTDGNKKIEIRPVTVWDNGKSPGLYSVLGYEFYLDGVAMAALQHPVDTFQKKLVWLKKDLDENMKLILAAASAVLFSFTNQVSG